MRLSQGSLQTQPLIVFALTLSLTRTYPQRLPMPDLPSRVSPPPPAAGRHWSVAAFVALAVLVCDQGSKHWARDALATPQHPLMVRGDGVSTLEALFEARGVGRDELRARADQRRVWLYRPVDPQELELDRRDPAAPRQMLWTGDCDGPAPRGLYVTLRDGDGPLDAWLKAQTCGETASVSTLWVMRDAAVQLDEIASPQTAAALLVRESEVFRPWLRFVYVDNPGAAWGFLSDRASSLRLGILGLIALFAVALLLHVIGRAQSRVVASAAALVLGGAVGNAIDRLRFSSVTDFILHAVGQWRWPVYNLADVAICVGGFTLCLVLLQDAFRAQGPSSS